MRILIVKTSSLGDLIHVFPTIEFLKARFPAAQIDWVVEKPFAEMLAAHPLIDKVLPINTKKWRKGFWKGAVWSEVAAFRKALQSTDYDVVFDLQGNTKSGLVTGMARAQTKVGFSRAAVAEWPNLLFTNETYAPPAQANIRFDYLSLAQQHCGAVEQFSDSGVRLCISLTQAETIKAILRCAQLRHEYRVMVCAGSIWPNKQVPEETLLNFLKLLNADRPASFLFVWGSADEKSVAERLSAQFVGHSLVIDKLPLASLQNLMAEVNLVVAMDSLPLHLAGTAGVATFSVFGASSAAKYMPQGDLHHALQGACPYGRQFEKRCPILRTCSTGQCIKSLAAEDLFAAYKKSTPENK